MKPIAVFRHAPSEGAGFFSEFLKQNNISMELIKIDEGVKVPDDPSAYSGMVFMGGPMSVNDDLPWIDPVCSLIREAVARDVPLLGHCLGGQLMSKALGSTVGRNPVKEIGWGEVSIIENAASKAWFGEGHGSFLSFHWHGETFTIPQGATRILESRYCSNQAWVMGKNLAMQCHVEMTPQMIKTWCEVGANEITENPGPAVQSVEAIKEDMSPRLAALNKVATTLYSKWLEGIAK